MKEADALQAISQGEGQCIEFKNGFAEEDAAIESLCAFTHAQGGTVYFGIDEQKGVIGVSLGKNTIEKFVKKLRDNTVPPLNSSIEACTCLGKTIVTAHVHSAKECQLFHAFGTPFIRVGKTNQRMSPEDIRERLFSGFKAENLQPQVKVQSPQMKDESWSDRESRRISRYMNNHGLFLVHTWRPSSQPGQVADIIISLHQHGDGPLSKGIVKSVEYHLGPKFFKHTIVKANPSDAFRLEVSAYGPMLCLARVNFDDGTPPLDIERYIDF